MGTPSHSKPKRVASADKIISEARARIIWGEPASIIREFLTTNGVPAEVAQAKLIEFESERNRELRRMGVRNVLIGGVLTGAAGVALYLAIGFTSATSGMISALAVVLLAGAYGAWKFLKGLAYLIRPQAEPRSIPDIAQSDLFE